MSEHQCIEFSIRERSHPVNTGRGGTGRSPFWNTRRLSQDKLQKHLEETRLIDELGWVKSAASLEDTVRAARQKVVAACDHSMLPRGHGRIRDSMYWWNDQLSVLFRAMITLMPVEIASGPAPTVLRLGRAWLSASICGGGSFYFSPCWHGYSACLRDVCPRMGVPGERMTEE